jgi:hypothetical protein
MAFNKKLRAFVRYDGKNRVVAGSLILQPNQPKVGKWKELPVYKCCIPPVYVLRLLFDDINNANALVGDSANVADWNTFFDLPTYGSPFTSVTIVGDEVQLTGGYNIEVKFRLFSDYDHLLEVNDDGALVILGDETFGGENGTSSLTSIIAPNVTTIIGDPVNYGAFGQCYNLVNAYLPNCVNIGACAFYDCEALPQSGLTLPFDQITSVGDYSFWLCYGLTELNFPSLVTAGNWAFQETYATSINMPLLETIGLGTFYYILDTNIDLNLPSLKTADEVCFSYFQGKSISLPLLEVVQINSFQYFGPDLSSISIPSCTNLGSSVLDDGVFLNNNSIPNTITLTVPSALMTCNSGQPDGDIQYLQANNTVIVITV